MAAQESGWLCVVCRASYYGPDPLACPYTAEHGPILVDLVRRGMVRQ